MPQRRLPLLLGQVGPRDHHGPNKIPSWAGSIPQAVFCPPLAYSHPDNRQPLASPFDCLLFLQEDYYDQCNCLNLQGNSIWNVIELLLMKEFICFLQSVPLVCLESRITTELEDISKYPISRHTSSVY